MALMLFNALTLVVGSFRFVTIHGKLVFIYLLLPPGFFSGYFNRELFERIDIAFNKGRKHEGQKLLSSMREDSFLERAGTTLVLFVPFRKV